MKCVNEKCNKNPMDSTNAVVVNADGDFACCKECAEEYQKQIIEFFDNIGDDNWYNNWMKNIN